MEAEAESKTSGGWSSATNWSIAEGGLVNSITVESSLSPIDESPPKSPLILNPPSADSAPCEIKSESSKSLSSVCFHGKLFVFLEPDFSLFSFFVLFSSEFCWCSVILCLFPWKAISLCRETNRVWIFILFFYFIFIFKVCLIQKFL